MLKKEKEKEKKHQKHESYTEVNYYKKDEINIDQ